MENEISELQSKIDVERNSDLSNVLKPIFKTDREISENYDRFEEYILERSAKDPKYYIFSTLMRPFFNQFTNSYFLSSKYQFFESLKEFSMKSLTVLSMQAYVSDTLSQFRNQTQIPSKPRLLRSDLGNIFPEKHIK